MEILLSATALAISLTAVWFASSSMKKMDIHFNEFIETNIKTLRNDLGGQDKALQALTTRVLRIEKDSATKEELKSILNKIELLQKDAEEMQDTLPKGPQRRILQSAKAADKK